jgi:predicted nucleic acid-binding protein
MPLEVRSVSESVPALIDTNVFIHALTHEEHSEECLRLLEAVAAGQVQVRLEPLVAHELSYALPHYRKQMSRAEVAEYLLAVLAWDGVVADKGLLVNAVERWCGSRSLAFVDAYLAALAQREGCAVYSMNVRELEALGAQVPRPLPGGAPL